VSTGIRGRPSRVPFAFAFRRPARTLSRMKSRSNSANAEITKASNSDYPIGPRLAFRCGKEVLWGRSSSLFDRCDGDCILSKSIDESERKTGGEYVNRNKTHHS
jgi:hypothetical protein